MIFRSIGWTDFGAWAGKTLKAVGWGAFALAALLTFANSMRDLAWSQQATFSNYIQSLGANAGSAPSFVARGTDTNIGMTNTSKGTGGFIWNAPSGGTFLFQNNAVTQLGVTSGGQISTYNAIATVKEGLPYQLASTDAVTQTANIAASVLLATTLVANVMYQVFCYVVESTAGASTSSTIPACNILYTDSDSGSTVTAVISASAGSAVAGTVGLPGTSGEGYTFLAKSSLVIQYSTTAYGSTPAGMQYAVRIRLLRLG